MGIITKTSRVELSSTIYLLIYLFFPFIGWIALSAQSWFSKGSTTDKICIAKTWYTVHINKHMNKVIKQEIYKYTMVKVNKTRQYKTWL